MADIKCAAIPLQKGVYILWLYVLILTALWIIIGILGV